MADDDPPMDCISDDRERGDDGDFTFQIPEEVADGFLKAVNGDLDHLGDLEPALGSEGQIDLPE
jgi:hypothetical protein